MEAIDIDQEEVPVETPETPPEEPEAPPEEPKPVTFSEEQQAKFNDEIGKKVAKQREAERQAEEERYKREAAEEELAKIKAPRRPDVPAMPDPYDDDFDSKVAERDKTIMAAAEYDAIQRRDLEAQQQQAQAQQRQAQEQIVRSVTEYSDRAEKLGIAAQELQVAGNIIAQHGLVDEVAHYILGEEQGPNITMYLSQNPMEIETIRAMDPMRAAIYIDSNIKAKATEARPSPTPAPAPVDNPTGKGMPPEQGPPGVTYE